MNRSPYGTSFLFFVIASIFIVELAAGLVGDELSLLMLGGVADNGNLHGQYWRLLSYAFLHATPVQLILNLVLLVLAGPAVERRIGIRRMLGLFIVASVLGGLAVLAYGAFKPGLGGTIGATAGMLGLIVGALWKKPAVA
jgi:membrane associated rhomboid family serine protease